MQKDLQTHLIQCVQLNIPDDDGSTLWLLIELQVNKDGKKGKTKTKQMNLLRSRIFLFFYGFKSAHPE